MKLIVRDGDEFVLETPAGDVRISYDKPDQESAPQLELVFAKEITCNAWPDSKGILVIRRNEPVVSEATQIVVCF